MKPYRPHIFAIIGVAILCFANIGSALTLGRARGAVLLGQPLKLTIPIRIAPGEGTYSFCFDADIFYGDAKQEPSRIGVTSDVSPESQAANVYVSALVNVDEPVVTVYLRAGCESKTTRRYVLLADVAADLTQPGKASNSPKLPMPGRTAAADATARPEVPETSAPRPPKRLSAVVSGAKRESAHATNTKNDSKTAMSNHPRLKLASVDLSVDRDPTLKLSDGLVLGDVNDLQRRAQSAALWQSLNATPQDVLSAQAHWQAMESDVRGLHDVTAKNRQILEELARRLDKAETERYSNPLVYGLAGAFLLCCILLAFGWLRVQRGGVVHSPWWRDERAVDNANPFDHAGEGREAVADMGADLRPIPNVHLDAQSQGVAERLKDRVTEVDIDLHLASSPKGGYELTPTPVTPIGATAAPTNVQSRAAGHLDFADSVTATLRAVNTQEMLDVRQQAEFFMTLGQHQEAISMLAENIETGTDSNPLVYLDLLKVLHTLGRKAEYDHYRIGFNAIFSGHVPEYADFNQATKGLDAYPDVCERIVTLWPSEQAIAYIEDSLVRSYGEQSVSELDLEAFRELLMLHGVARRIASALDSGFLPFSAARSMPSEADPFFTSDLIGGANAVENKQPDSAHGDRSASTEVDFDLSEPPGNLIDFDTADLMPSRPST